jgi:hypothetical protein
MCICLDNYGMEEANRFMRTKITGQQSPDVIRQKASAFWMAGLARAQAVQT